MSDDLIALARENVEAFNDGDWDRFRATLADDSVYEEPGTQRKVEGPDAITELNAGWKAAFFVLAVVAIIAGVRGRPRHRGPAAVFGAHQVPVLAHQPRQASLPSVTCRS